MHFRLVVTCDRPFILYKVMCCVFDNVVVCLSWSTPSPSCVSSFTYSDPPISLHLLSSSPPAEAFTLCRSRSPTSLQFQEHLPGGHVSSTTMHPEAATHTRKHTNTRTHTHTHTRTHTYTHAEKHTYTDKHTQTNTHRPTHIHTHTQY